MRGLVLAALVALTTPVLASAQISPGPLSRAHQSLEGATQCARCHGPAADAMPRLCLSCHREIAWLVAQRRGVHAREAKTSGKSCGSCHPDHAGRDFQMIAWPAGGSTRFDHRGAGWALDGKHANLTCEKCHRTELRVGPAAALSPRKGTAGWVGLEATCVSCHKRDDLHANTLGSECQRCHDASGWKPAPGFNHDDSRYPLSGKHTDVACDKCHLATSLALPVGADGKRLPRFRPLAFVECSSCHADAHRGQLSARCSTCHVTRGFDVIDRRDFNHSTTRYPLVGKHRTARCEACHGRAMAQPKPSFATCAGCHADVHGGEATLAGAKVDCAGCHRVEGFRPSSFTLAQHQSTRFPVNGKHSGVACAKCHTSTANTGGASRLIRLRVASADCASCHVDPHAGQLAGTRCVACHTDANWSTIAYDRAAHANTRLPLEGAHAALACAACHGPRRVGLPAPTVSAATGIKSGGVTFRITEVRCASCHADPHRAARDAGAGDSTATCEKCHNSVAFRPATVDIAAHGQFAFRLEGAHRAVACGACHTGLATGNQGGRATLLNAPGPRAGVPLRAVRGTTCAACHESPHGAQFASRPDGGRCEACHGPDVFAIGSRFDHNRDAAFSLAGAHSQVACDRCHRSETIGGTRRVLYRPIPHRCENCHATKPSGRSQ